MFYFISFMPIILKGGTKKRKEKTEKLLTQLKANLSLESHWADFASRLKYECKDPVLLWPAVKPSTLFKY